MEALQAAAATSTSSKARPAQPAPASVSPPPREAKRDRCGPRKRIGRLVAISSCHEQARADTRSSCKSLPRASRIRYPLTRRGVTHECLRLKLETSTVHHIYSSARKLTSRAELYSIIGDGDEVTRTPLSVGVIVREHSASHRGNSPPIDRGVLRRRGVGIKHER